MEKTVAIIGAGPAGMAAALQLRRFGIKILLFEQKESKSLLKNAWCVENHLGCYPGKTGIKLLCDFHKHLARNKVKTIRSKVELLDYNGKTQLFRIKAAKKTYISDYAVVASGTKPKLLLQNPPAAISNHLFYEVFPLLKKRNKTILIIGAGDAAFDNALNLAKHNRVIILNRSKYIDSLPLLVNKAMKNPNISYFEEHEIYGIVPTTADKKISVMFTKRRKKVYIEADYLLVAIGRLPQKDFYTGKLWTAEKRLIKEGRLFLVGDAKNDLYRQVAIAIGDGIRVAMHIFHNSE